MNDAIRQAFERVSMQNFTGMKCEYDYVRGVKTFPRNIKNEYIDPVIEDHWQTFQEGWECALEHLKNKSNPCYTDVVSNGGMDPRGMVQFASKGWVASE